MNGLITVSNGETFRHISASELPQAKEDGFYCPSEMGMTIIGNDDYQFEIPVTDIETAAASGLSDWLAQERVQYSVDNQSMLISDMSQAKMLAEQERLGCEQELESSAGIAWYFVLARQWFSARRVFLERQLGSHGISIMIHLAIFLLLASLVLVDEPETLDITNPTEVETEDSPPEAEEIELAETEYAIPASEIRNEMELGESRCR